MTALVFCPRKKSYQRIEYQSLKEVNIFTKKKQIKQSDELSLIQDYNYKFVRRVDKWQELIMLD